MKRVDIFSKKYYTDWHNVDEDLRTIICHNGYYKDEYRAGIAQREMRYVNSHITPNIASSTAEMSIHYTDWHDVDEDSKTICDCGGHWADRTSAGIAYRGMDFFSTQTRGFVASSTIEVLILYGLS